jgi:hypothetical protein
MGEAPGSRTELTEKGTRVITLEEAQSRKRRAEEKLEASTLKQQRMEEKRQEKAFEQAILEGPMGGIYEVQPAAENNDSESIVFRTMNPGGGFTASVVEVLKAQLFVVAPESDPDLRIEDCENPPPRLKKDKVKRGYAHNGRKENMGVWTTVVAETKDDWTFIHISFPSAI